ncbi:uncharacterized protein LOC121188160 isoform X2 [Toxotes jaculatrix]|nr:uncharacterized protein LOC121188160 isoform X2 [Toxotes jaculatrix]
MICERKGSGSLFWIRLVSGNFPEVLGKTYSLKTAVHHITVSEEPEKFVLHIERVKLNDTAVYYCMKTYRGNITFLNGTDLRVKGPEPDITTTPPSDPVCPEDPVSVQCSVLANSQNKTYHEENCMRCIRAGSHQSHPSFNCTQGKRVDEYQKKTEGLSTKNCICSFSENISSSDAGTCYCAVATYGQIFSGNNSKLPPEVWHSQKERVIIFLLCAALTISLIVTAFLIYFIKKLKKSSHYYAAVALQTTATASSDQERQQTDEDSLVYSAPTFTGRKASKGGTRETKTETESIYTDVRALGMD